VLLCAAVCIFSWGLHLRMAIGNCLCLLPACCSAQDISS